MLGDTYLFIDGGYLRETYRDLFQPLFGDGYLVDYQSIMKSFGARRAFLYDCLDDEQKPGETGPDFAMRVQKQQDLFDAIDRVPGVHVCYGVLSQGRKRQQKEVGVSLAVDMLTHSFSKNMDEAVLLAGDRDFRPVVEAIVRLGTLVKVAYEPRSASRELARAADSEKEIDITTLCSWVKLDKHVNAGQHFPWCRVNEFPDQHPYKQSPGYQEGVIGPQALPLGLVELSGVWHAAVKTSRRDYFECFFHDKSTLLAYLVKLYGEIVW
jgi:uncharacterized LabA/DUF88 family protein